MTAISPFYLSLVKTDYLLERVEEARQFPDIALDDLNQLGVDLKAARKEIQGFVRSGGPFKPKDVKRAVASFRARLYAIISETKEEKTLAKTQFFNRNADKVLHECAQSRLQRYAAKINELRLQPRSNFPLLIQATKVIIEADEKIRRLREQTALEEQMKSSWGLDGRSILPRTNIPIFANTHLDDETSRITTALHFLIASMQEESPTCLLRVIDQGKKTAAAVKRKPQEDLLETPDLSNLERLIPQPLFLDRGDKNSAFCKLLQELESNGVANGLFIVSGIVTFGNESCGIVLNYGRLAKLVGIFDPCGYTKVRPPTDKLSAYFIAFKDIKDAAEFLANRFEDSPPHHGGQMLPLKLKEKSTTRVNFLSAAMPGTAPRPADNRRSLSYYLRVARTASDSVRSRQGKTLGDFLKAAKLSPDYARYTSRGFTLTEIYYQLDALRDAVAVQDKAAIKQAFQTLSQCALPSTIRTGYISDFLYEQLYLNYKALWEANPALPDPHQKAFNNQFGQLAFHNETDIAIDPQVKLAVIDKVKKTLKSNWRI